MRSFADGFAPISRQRREAICAGTSSAPCGGTFPKGEGFWTSSVKPLPHRPIDFCTYPDKVTVNVCVTESNDCQAEVGQILISVHVPLSFVGFIVLGTVQFNDQLCTGTVEIHNIMAELLLSAKCSGVRFQEVIPKVPLLPSHLATQFLRIGLVITVVVDDLRHMSSQKPSPLGKVARSEAE